ncbi:Protein kinase-like domain [Pseudocohnilembus persalinus]|uniref:Protein kinase-like domain n=1 Tax=Pseudocohnilembus persalinus TaxID=266149 RepID=A0A0V0QHW2_PSEPJ|nr:Protein kinase-like domain [Pseudocohnilembus persalinus]|eukprot:KRX01849.1 Protein kinase-like domain [Pseudocohnilembus persalinus]
MNPNVNDVIKTYQNKQTKQKDKFRLYNTGIKQRQLDKKLQFIIPNNTRIQQKKIEQKSLNEVDLPKKEFLNQKFNITNEKVTMQNNINCQNNSANFKEIQLCYSQSQNIQQQNESIQSFKIDNIEKNKTEGGFSIVWLAQSEDFGQYVAIKQIQKQTGSKGNTSFLKELEFYNKACNITQENSTIEKHILKLLDIINDEKCIWIVEELGGQVLSNHLLSLKGQFYNLKPDNILVKLNQDETSLEQLKIIDYGSSFNIKGRGSAAITTVEYMPPEIIGIYCQNKQNVRNANYKNKYSGISNLEMLNQICNPWSIDVWGLGMILIEILSGIPNWLSYNCMIEKKVVDTFLDKNEVVENNKEKQLKVDMYTSKIKQSKSKSNDSKYIIKQGLFAQKGQGYDKIYQKQQKIDQYLKSYCEDFLILIESKKQQKLLFDLIQKMLLIDPLKRISPDQILNHKFLKEKKKMN